MHEHSKPLRMRLSNIILNLPLCLFARESMVKFLSSCLDLCAHKERGPTEISTETISCLLFTCRTAIGDGVVAPIFPASSWQCPVRCMHRCPFLVGLVRNRGPWFTWWFNHLPGPSLFFPPKQGTYDCMPLFVHGQISCGWTAFEILGLCSPCGRVPQRLVNGMRQMCILQAKPQGLTRRGCV